MAFVFGKLITEALPPIQFTNLFRSRFVASNTPQVTICNYFFVQSANHYYFMEGSDFMQMCFPEVFCEKGDHVKKVDCKKASQNKVGITPDYRDPLSIIYVKIRTLEEKLGFRYEYEEPFNPTRYRRVNGMTFEDFMYTLARLHLLCQRAVIISTVLADVNKKEYFKKSLNDIPYGYNMIDWIDYVNRDMKRKEGSYWIYKNWKLFKRMNLSVAKINAFITDQKVKELLGDYEDKCIDGF